MGRESPKTAQDTAIAAAQSLGKTDKPTLFVSQDKPVPQTAIPNSKFWFRDRLIETFIEKLELRRGRGLMNFTFIEKLELRRGRGLMSFRCLTGAFEMVEDYLDELGIFDDGDDAHSTTTGTGKDIDVVNAFN